VIDLPPRFARHFLDSSGRTDYRALVRTPDTRLVALARELTPDERAWLYYRLQTFRPGIMEVLAAGAAGFDVDVERQRLMGLLEVADEAELANV
jgi:hypothetical protein